MGSDDALLSDLDLSDVDPFWSGPLTDRHAGFAALRRRDPIRFFAEVDNDFLPAGPGYWAITRHADVIEASRHPEWFCSGEGVNITDVKEKPNLTFFVNAGIYLIEPDVCKYIPRNKKFDMTDLIDLLIEEGENVVSFPIREYWLDIGKHEDYLRAQEDVKHGRLDN